MSAPASDVRFEGVTIRDRRRVICREVTLSVTPGSFYALLGHRGAGKSSLIRSLLGRQKPQEGVAYLFENPSRKATRDALAQVALVSEEPEARPRQTARELVQRFRRRASIENADRVEATLARRNFPLETPWRDLSRDHRREVALALALGQAPRLLVLDEPAPIDEAVRGAIWSDVAFERTRRRMTVFAATADASGVEAGATHVGILKDGRLVVNEPLEAVKARFRRLSYVNEITPERAEYGNELDEFDAVRVRARGWGVEAIVSNFDTVAFSRFQAIPGLSDANAEALTLEEIFVAIAGAAPRGR